VKVNFQSAISQKILMSLRGRNKEIPSKRAGGLGRLQALNGDPQILAAVFIPQHRQQSLYLGNGLVTLRGKNMKKSSQMEKEGISGYEARTNREPGQGHTDLPTHTTVET